MVATVTKLGVFSHTPSITTGEVLWVRSGKVINVIGKTIQIEFLPRVWYWPFKTRQWFHCNDVQYLVNVKNPLDKLKSIY